MWPNWLCFGGDSVGCFVLLVVWMRRRTVLLLMSLVVWVSCCLGNPIRK